jgi:hypothetical protein
MDLSLLSPEVQRVIVTANFDNICDMAERVRGRDNNAYSVLQQVIEAFRNWNDFESGGPANVRQGAKLMIQLAREQYHVVLPEPRALELVRLVYIFEKAFGFDPVSFTKWILERGLEQMRIDAQRARRA